MAAQKGANGVVQSILGLSKPDIIGEDLLADESDAEARIATMGLMTSDLTRRHVAASIAAAGAGAIGGALLGKLAADGDASQTQVVSPFGVKRAQSQRANDRITIEDLGGGTDKTAEQNLAALTDPRAAGRTVRLGDGTYFVAGTVTLPVAVSGRAMSLGGNGRDRTKLVNTTANLPTIKIHDYVSYTTIGDLTLDRSLTATSGGDGIVVGDNVSHIRLDGITSQNNYRGFNLGTTDVGYLYNVEAKNNISHGFLFQNNSLVSTGGLPIQWNFSGRNISQYNGGDGYRVQTNPGSRTRGAAEIVLGEFAGVSTAGNVGSGIGLYGAVNLPISDFRLGSHFIGGDAGVEVYLDTYGHSHVITGGFIEYAGSWGIFATGNNEGLNVTGTHLLNTKKNAIYSRAKKTSITGVTIEAAGQDTTESNPLRASVYLEGADSSVVGGILDGGTFGVVAAAARANIIGPTIINTAVQPMTGQSDTMVRGVRGVADAN